MCVFLGFFPLERDARFCFWLDGDRKKKIYTYIYTKSHKSPVTKIWHWTIQHTELLSRSHMGHIYEFFLSPKIPILTLTLTNKERKIKKGRTASLVKFNRMTAQKQEQFTYVSRVKQSTFDTISKNCQKRKVIKRATLNAQTVAEC